HCDVRLESTVSGFWLVMVAVVPSNFVILIVNGSLYDLARSCKTLSATASPNKIPQWLELRKWIPEWTPCPKGMLNANLLSSPLISMESLSAPVYVTSERPSVLGCLISDPAASSSGRSFALPSMKNLTTVAHAPATVEWPPV